MVEAVRLFAPKRGALIVFEGIDRSGKSSQASLLHERLLRDGVQTKLISFPDRNTPIGKMINESLSGKAQLPAQALHLLFAANRWELQPKISKWLDEGYVLILDRYSFSGVVYSTTAANMLASKAAEQGHVGAAPIPVTCDFAKMTEEGLPEPDKVFFLDVKPEEARDRRGFGGEMYETLEVQQRVYAAYSMFEPLSFWRILPAAKVSAEALHDLIVKEVQSLFKEMDNQGENTKRRTLWGHEHR